MGERKRERERERERERNKKPIFLIKLFRIPEKTYRIHIKYIFIGEEILSLLARIV